MKILPTFGGDPVGVPRLQPSVGVMSLPAPLNQYLIYHSYGIAANATITLPVQDTIELVHIFCCPSGTPPANKSIAMGIYRANTLISGDTWTGGAFPRIIAQAGDTLSITPNYAVSNLRIVAMPCHVSSYIEF